MLPLANESVDALNFNTSLDQILDYKTAINEAHRVLEDQHAEIYVPDAE